MQGCSAFRSDLNAICKDFALYSQPWLFSGVVWSSLNSFGLALTAIRREFKGILGFRLLDVRVVRLSSSNRSHQIASAADLSILCGWYVHVYSGNSVDIMLCARVSKANQRMVPTYGSTTLSRQTITADNLYSWWQQIIIPDALDSCSQPIIRTDNLKIGSEKTNSIDSRINWS